MATIQLTDDGTLDTVLRCSECGEEFRGTYAASEPDSADYSMNPNEDGSSDYDAWVADFIAEVSEDHDCTTSGPTEPEEEDLTTSDHRTFYQSGKAVLQLRTRTAGGEWWEWYGQHALSDEDDANSRPGAHAPTWHRLGVFPDCEAAVRAYMDRVRFWPNCWVISDHGNAHLMDLTGGK